MPILSRNYQTNNNNSNGPHVKYWKTFLNVYHFLILSHCITFKMSRILYYNGYGWLIDAKIVIPHLCKKKFQGGKSYFQYVTRTCSAVPHIFTKYQVVLFTCSSLLVLWIKLPENYKNGTCFSWTYLLQQTYLTRSEYVVYVILAIPTAL